MEIKNWWNTNKIKVWSFITLNLINLYVILLLLLLAISLFSQSMLKIIIWPSFAAIFMISFKEQLSNLMNRIIGLKIPGGEFQMQHIKSETNEQNFLENIGSVIKSKEEELNKINSDNDQLIQQIAIRDIIIHFERIYNLIFPSQIKFLWKLNDNSSGLSRLEVERYFNILKSSVPLFYNWTWEGYINFLCQENLMVLVNSNFVITEYGNAFIQYILYMNYQKPGDF